MANFRNRFVVAPLVAALSLSGCESMGPRAARKLPLPANLAVETNKGLDAPMPTQSEPLTQQATRPPEFYPSSGGVLGEGPSEPLPPRKDGKYTLNFDDADLAEVAKTILGDTLKVNYILSPKVTGKISLQTTRPLADDELIPTLEMLLKMNGAVLIKDGPLYKIEPDASAVVDAPGPRVGGALPTGYQMRIVPLKYVGVQEMQKVIEPMMPPKSVIRADEVRNILVVAGSSDEVAGVLETIRMFDVDFMRGMSVALFPLKNVEAPTIVEELDKVLGDTHKGPLAGLLRLLPIERLNAVLAVTPQPRYLQEVETWIERLDRYNSARAGGVHVYRVQNVDATELANTLSAIFGTGGNSGGGRGRGSLSPGSRGAEVGGGGLFSGGGSSSGSGSSSFGDDSSSSSGSLGGGGFGSNSGGIGGSSGGGFGNSSSGGIGGSSGGLGGSSGGIGGGGRSSFGSSGSRSGGIGGGGGGFSGGGAFGTRSGAGGGGGRGRGGAAAADLGNVRIVADPSNNALIIIAKAQEFKEIEAVVKELDQVPLQVLIDATIAEINLTDDLSYGLSWFIQHGINGSAGDGALGTGNTGGTNGIDLINLAKDVGANLGTGGFTYAFSPNSGRDFKVVLTTLAKERKVNFLSTPSLMVLNNQEANIKVGDSVPVQTGSFQSTLTANTGISSSISYRDTGVILNIRPRVNAGGLVLMDIEQAVDNVGSSTATANTAVQNNTPTFQQRQIKSSVAVANGDTLVLGGLIRENVTFDQGGIPVLYKIPYIGSLFGTKTTNNTRTELVVLITPRVVESRAKSRDITNEFRRKLSGLYEADTDPGAVSTPPPVRPTPRPTVVRPRGAVSAPIPTANE